MMSTLRLKALLGPALIGSLIGLAATPAVAGNCNDTSRARDTTWNSTKADTHIINKTSITRTVQFGIWPKGREKKKKDEITLKPGEKATLGDKVGKDGNTQFELYVLRVADGEVVSGQNELKCIYVINNSGTGYPSSWRKWKCVTDAGKSSAEGSAKLASEEGGIGYACEKSWKPNKKGWDTTLTIKDF